MRNSFSRKQLGLAVACALALGLASGTARAQLTASGWLQDSSGNAVTTGNGTCVHAGTPATPKPTPRCDPTYRPVAQSLPVAPPSQLAAMASAPAQRLTFDADTLFDYDKSTLRPSGRRTLDNFSDRIRAINPETIMVVGHASRPGTERYNQRLSEDRAESVKTYLVSTGIAPYRIRTSGVGEMQPTTLEGECLNDLSAKAIACRQPDRRVDIELTGARIPR